MLQLKQGRYPVIFLTQGATSKYPPYLDVRTQSVDLAVRFALSESLLGVNIHTEDLLKDFTIIKRAKDVGLRVFCWGEDNNSSRNVELLKEHNVDAIILDRIDLYATNS